MLWTRLGQMREKWVEGKFISNFFCFAVVRTANHKILRSSIESTLLHVDVDVPLMMSKLESLRTSTRQKTYHSFRVFSFLICEFCKKVREMRESHNKSAKKKKARNSLELRPKIPFMHSALEMREHRVEEREGKSMICEDFLLSISEFQWILWLFFIFIRRWEMFALNISSLETQGSYKYFYLMIYDFLDCGFKTMKRWDLQILRSTRVQCPMQIRDDRDLPIINSTSSMNSFNLEI